MNTNDKVVAIVNGVRTEGVYVRPINRKNRHRIAVDRAGRHRAHWVTVSTKKLQA